MDNQQLRTGFQEAKRITKKFAKTFYLASLFLPKDKKYASYAVYAICRLSDETVDDLTCPDPELNLQKLEQKIAASYTQDIIDTLGKRLTEIIIPVPNDKKLSDRIARETQEVIEERAKLSERARMITLDLLGPKLVSVADSILEDA